MAIQNECDVCGELWPVDFLIRINLMNKLMCPECVNGLIDALASELPDKVLKANFTHNKIVWGE